MINNLYNIFSHYEPYINGYSHFKRSAVIVPLLTINSSTYILFEKRSMNLRSHPGEICFPGGRIETGESPLSAAYRETFEEINLSKDTLSLITPLALFISPFNVIVHPFLVEISDINSLKLNEAEVADIIIIPLSFFLETEPKKSLNKVKLEPNNNFPYELINKDGKHNFTSGTYELLFYNYKNICIWGLTARILYDFITYLKKHKIGTID